MLGWPLRSVLLVYAATLALAIAAPDALLGFAAKEGPLEQGSHVVLAAAVVAWLVRVRQPPRWAPLVLALALAVVLAEETDWGALVADNALTSAFARLTGRPRLHADASYLLFAIPWLAWLAASLAPTWRMRLGPHAASRDEVVAAGLVAVATLGSVLLPIEWERALEEISETIFYALLFASAVRRR